MALDYISKEEAEKIVGFKLDGRRKYFMWSGDVCYDEKTLISCSGCTEYSEGYLVSGIWDEKRKMIKGCGCPECGYTGVRIEHFPCPVFRKEDLEDL